MPFEIKIALQVGKHMKSLPKDETRVIKSHIDKLKKDPYTKINAIPTRSREATTVL